MIVKHPSDFSGGCFILSFLSAFFALYYACTFSFMLAPNFLRTTILDLKAKPSCALLTTLIVWLALVMGFWPWQPAVSAVLLGILVVVILSRHLEIGLYVILFFGFFLGWQIDFSRFAWAKTLPIIPGLNAPLVEFLAVGCLLALAVAWFLRMPGASTHLLVQKLWGFRYYGLFLLLALVSAFMVYDGITGSSFKYWFRVMAFAYVAFLWFPLIVIRDREIFYRAVKLWAFLAIGIALFGLSSLVAVSQGAVVRLVPYNIFGIAPLGYNHNLLAEPLVVLLPLVVALAMEGKKRERTWYLLGAGIIGLAALLTLSRAAWLAMLTQAMVAVLFLSRQGVKAKFVEWSKSILPFLVVFLPILLYMGYFLTTSIVASSTSARVAASEATWFYALREPWLGYGPGTYQKLLGETNAYTIDFGEPLDAHGFLQKVLLEEGGLGVLFFLGFLLYVFMTVWRQVRYSHEGDRPMAIALLLMVTGIMVFELFNTSYFQSVMWLPFGVAIAGVHVLRPAPQN